MSSFGQVMLVAAGLAAFGLAHGQPSPPPAGSIAEIVRFSVFDAPPATTLADRTLADYEGRIVLLVYYAPW